MNKVSEENRKVPKIRFRGFNDDCNLYRLGDVVERIKSYSLSRDVETEEYTGYKYIHYGDIHTKVADIIDEYSNLPNINPADYVELQKGDIIVADASEDYNGIAEPSVIISNLPYKLVSGLHTIALRPNKINSLFLYYLLHTQLFKKHGWKTGTGIKVFGINLPNLLKFEFGYTNLEEQTKIGILLKQIDTLISLHQRELENSKKLKKSMLQKMFPKNGENVPEVRFEGFTGDWDKRKLGEIADITKLAGFEFTTYVTYSNKGNIPAIRGLNVKNGKFIFEDVKYIDGSDFSKLNRSKLLANDIVFTYVGTIGEAAIIPQNVNWYLAPNVSRIRLKKLDSQFILQLLLNPEFRKREIEIWIATSSQPALSMENIRKFTLYIPTYEEQIKIGNFFKNLDTLITHQEKKLKTYQTLKKTLLQKMFI